MTPLTSKGGFVDFSSESLGGTLDFLDFSGDYLDELGLKFDWWDSPTSLQKPHFQTHVTYHFKNFRLRRLISYLNQFAIYCSLVFIKS